MLEADSPPPVSEGDPAVVPLPPPPSPSSGLSIFVGPDGLRVGWRFLLYLLLYFVFSLGLTALLGLIHQKPLATIWFLLFAESLQLTAAVAPALIMAKLEGRQFSDYGLPVRLPLGKMFWVGGVWGLAGLTLLLLMMRAAGAFYFGQVALHGVRIVKFAIFYGVVFLVVALFEEFWVRGYSLFTLSKGIGFWPASVMLSVAFGAIHLGNKGEALTGAAAAALIGFFFCLTLRRTGTLWFAVGFHAAWDWGETFLYSVPHSGLSLPGRLMRPAFQGKDWLTGGSVGPEGSIFVFLVMGILALAFHRLYREAKYLV
jgi:membrane protease YdiL (CAAX protease family)